MTNETHHQMENGFKITDDAEGSVSSQFDMALGLGNSCGCGNSGSCGNSGGGK